MKAFRGRADVLVSRMGAALIGCKVNTPAVGAYPGGVAVVTELHPDPAAPEIVFVVRHPTWTDEDGEDTIGVYEDEQVELIQKGK